MSKIILSIEQGLVNVYSSRMQHASSNSLIRLLSTHHHQSYFGTLSSVSSSQLKPQCIRANQTPFRKRNLYTERALGIDRLDLLRGRAIQLDEAGKNRYIERVSQYLQSGDANSIFKGDLVNLIAFAQDDQHLDLIERTAMSLKSEHGYHTGTWGLSVMRLYYRMNQLDRAYNNIKNTETFGQFFNQPTSYQIVMTMLYNAGRYEDIIEIYKLSSERLEPSEFPTNRRLSMIVFAAYAKINTPEALEMAEKLYSQDTANPYKKLRTVTFLSYLAVNHGQPTLALNLLADSRGKQYISLRMLHIIALIKLKRYEDILYHLRETIKYVTGEVNVILKDVYTLIEGKMDEIEDENVREDLKDALAEIKSRKLVGDATLESIIFKEIDLRKDFDQERPYQRARP